jgi:hypothetical protein
MKNMVYVCVWVLLGWLVSPVHGEHTAEQVSALKEIRAAMAGRDLPGLAKKIAAAQELKGAVEFVEELNRLQLLAKYVQTFWEAVDQGAMKSLNAGELDVDGKLVSVVDYDRRLFVIRSEGENKRYTLETIPPKLALVLSQWELPKTNAQNKVCFGAFLAMDGKGDRRIARQYWQEAASAGGDVKGLLPELEIALAAAPIALPELTPAVRNALNPAQWQLRIKQETKTTREPLGKGGDNSSEGWLQIEPAEQDDVQVVNKNRVSGDFSCRVYLDGVVAGQSFGLYPALPSETPVVVALPEGRVKVELLRKKGLYYCRVNDQDVELKPSEKSAEKLAGYLGVSLSTKAKLVIASFEFANK